MKISVALLLFILGIVGYAVCWADTSLPDGMAYHATIAADGVQHVKIEGGG